MTTQSISEQILRYILKTIKKSLKYREIIKQYHFDFFTLRLPKLKINFSLPLSVQCSTTLWQQMKRETNPAGYVCMSTPFILPFRQHHKSIKTPVLSVNRPHPSTGGNKKTNPVDPIQLFTKAMMVSGPRSYTEHQAELQHKTI